MANVLPGKAAVDLGNGMAGTFFDDGSVQIWSIGTGQQVAWVQPGNYSYDLGTGQAATQNNGQFSVYNIGNQPNASGFPNYSLNLAPPVGAGGGITGAVGGAGTTYPAWMGGQTVAPSNPWTIGAGTAGAPYGQGWGFGNTDVTIRPEYLQYLMSQVTGQQGGYIPGSSTFNQFPLNDPGLLTTILGKTVNARYGQGGTGDPTTGREPQTPEEWLNGPKAFGWDFNMGQTDATRGMDYIANLFGRPDAGSSGISTAAWSAPNEYWAGLADAVQKGLVKASAFGLKALAAKGFNVTPPGGAVDLGGGTAASGAGGADSALQDYLASIQANAQAMQAAQLAYQDWYMRTQDDQQAFAHAQQEYENRWQESMFTYQKQKDQWALQQSAGYFDVDGQRTPTLAGIAQEAGLTGMYQGKPTFQREQYESGVMQNLLSLQAGLRGPENYAQYLKVLGSTPQGMRDVVNSAAGRFQMPSTFGVTPGQSANPADVQSLLRDVTSGAPQAQADWSQALSGGLPAPNQISLRNYSNMTPTQRSMLMSAYEGSGWDPKDVQDLIAKSSPLGAVGGGASAGTFKF